MNSLVRNHTWRDLRIALIYEGTNGVQALDLVGRKLAANGGRAVMSFFSEIDGFLSQEGKATDPALAPFLHGLAGVKAQLQDATLWLMQNGLANPDNAGAASTDYMHLFGLTGLAYMWALMAKAAEARTLTARGWTRTLRLARTIADLEAAPSVRRVHVAEALIYRRVGPASEGLTGAAGL